MSHTAAAAALRPAGGFGWRLLAWGLAFHAAVIAVLFGFVGVPAAPLRVLAAWKEAAVLALLTVAVARAAFGRVERTTIAWTDLLVTGLLALATIFLIAGQSWFQFNNPTEATLYGFRDAAFFLLLYYVGRLTPGLASNPKTLKVLYSVALVTASIGIIEWVFMPLDFLVIAGVSAYFQDFLGASAFTTGTELGLPHSYWTRIGGREVQRAGSVYLSGQGMAVPFLVLLPAATAWLFHRRPIPALRAIGYGIIWLGFLLSITRMTTIALIFAMVAFALMLRKPEWTVAMLGFGGVVFVIGMFVIPGLPSFIWDTLTWQTGSSQTHLDDWARGYLALFERPLGWGLGTGDLAAVRSGLQPLAMDNQFLRYGVEMGFPGFILHILVFAGILGAAARVVRSSPDSIERLMGVALIATTIGIVLNSLTGSVFNSLTVAYLYFWMAGSVVSVAQRMPQLGSRHISTAGQGA